MIDTIQEWMIAAQKLICEGYFMIKESMNRKNSQGVHLL
jgi:phage antirepressor YoqD-like protein